MPFNTLLLTCLQPGQTILEDSNTKILLKGLQSNEVILVFGVDDQSHPHCKLRQFLWEQQKGQSLCDFIVFYAKDEQRVMCFVELKDNKKDFGKAVHQVINTYDAFKRHLKFSYISKAFIAALQGSPPTEHHEHQQNLNAIFRQGNYLYDGGHIDFLEFLRGTLNPKKDKFKKGNVRK